MFAERDLLQRSDPDWSPSAGRRPPFPLGRCVNFLGSGEPTLDQLFAEPIVRQLMHRDGTDEAATRRLLQRVAAAGAPKFRSATGCVPG
jgi:hypothetical protein